jgi:DNA-binding transcriptional regulator/RsmH inhibitor MraZ
MGIDILCGTFLVHLDEKRRFTVSSGLTKLNPGDFVYIHNSTNLRLIPEHFFEKYLSLKSKRFFGLIPSKKEGIIASSYRVPVDNQHRVTIPYILMDKTNISIPGEIFLVGREEYIEIQNI